MKTWLAVVTIQLAAKSYPHQHTTRVRASSASVAANKANREALLALRSRLKRRRVQGVSVALTNLGRVPQPATLHSEETRTA